MVFQEPIVIDLGKYGETGYVSLEKPLFSKQARMEKAGANMCLTFKKNGEPVIDSSNSLEAQFMMEIFPYIEDAPFDLTLDSFFEFTDKLDGIRRGAGEEFYNELVEGIAKVKSGATSPSPDSQEAKTASLD